MTVFVDFWCKIYQKAFSCVTFQLCTLKNVYKDLYIEIIVTKSLENSKFVQCAIFVHGYLLAKTKNSNISGYE